MAILPGLARFTFFTELFLISVTRIKGLCHLKVVKLPKRACEWFTGATTPRDSERKEEGHVRTFGDTQT